MNEVRDDAYWRSRDLEDVQRHAGIAARMVLLNAPVAKFIRECAQRGDVDPRVMSQTMNVMIFDYPVGHRKHRVEQVQAVMRNQMERNETIRLEEDQ